MTRIWYSCVDALCSQKLSLLKGPFILGGEHFHDRLGEMRKAEKRAAGETVRDIVIGMSDGLTVPFALAAGLSGAVSSPAIIVTAGLAEIAAGSIAMGLGGYLAARSDAEHYASERRREQQEIKEKTEAENAEVRDVFTSYGLTEVESAPIVEALSKRPQAWIDFMMRFELGLEEPTGCATSCTQASDENVLRKRLE